MKRRDRQTLGKLAAIQGFQSLMRDHETEMKAAMAQTGRMLLPDVDWGLAVATALSRGSTPEDLAREAATRTLADLDAGRWTEAEAPLVMQGRFFTVLSAYLAVGDEASAATATSAWRQLSSPGS